MNTIRLLLNSKVLRYFFSAGVATCVDVGTYFLCFNFLFDKADIDFQGLFILSAPTASLVISYSAGLLTNFTITKRIVFNESELAVHQQFFRFVLVAMIVLGLTWLFMRWLIRGLSWYPTIARASPALTIGVFSFLVHKSFSFRTPGTSGAEK